VGFIFSKNGFTKDAEDYCQEKGIACSEDERWLESGQLKPPIVLIKQRAAENPLMKSLLN